ncbi:MAG: CbtB-domain containing protein [Proteobacteria bacterium]|nr:CbtB-domain containing protein [Pseudomonadota bacterium]
MHTYKPASSAKASEASAISNAILVALPSLIALALAIGIIAVIGFAGSEMLHGAAHDLRHASGFPCH